MKKVSKIIIPAELVWNASKPRYNGFAVGHGPHSNKKRYCRKAKHKNKEVYHE